MISPAGRGGQVGSGQVGGPSWESVMPRELRYADRRPIVREASHASTSVRP